MTVEELIQELVERCHLGQAKWQVRLANMDVTAEEDRVDIFEVDSDPHKQEVVII